MNKNQITIEQIKTVHTKAKSGGDFLNYAQDLILLGVKNYETFVKDGHIDYFGGNNYDRYKIGSITSRT